MCTAISICNILLSNLCTDKPVAHPSIYRSGNCNGKFKAKVKMITLPGGGCSCTVKYKQLETCTQNVQCCSARPKSILPDPKTEQEGKVLMLDKLFLNTMIKRSLLPRLCFHRGGQQCWPNTPVLSTTVSYLSCIPT